MKKYTTMARRIISAFLCCVLIFPCALGVSASELEELSNSISLWGHTYAATDVSCRAIYDTNGNQFILYEIGSQAYYIFDPISEKFLEGSPSAPSPYLNKTGNLIYLGPTNYYVKTEDCYVHTVLGSSNSLSNNDVAILQKTFGQMLNGVQNEALSTDNIGSTLELNGIYDNMIEDDCSDEGYINYYITGYTNIQNATYPDNEGDTCGYVAGTLVLYYWHKRLGGIIPSAYLNTNGKLKTDGATANNNLQKKLISLGNGGSSWALEIRDVLIAYCEWKGISATSTYYLTGIGYRDELHNNRPAILFGSFPNVNGGLPVFHAVTAYGFHLDNENAIISTIVHYGWSGYSEVYLDTGLIGSVTLFNPQ